jgi:hypothetical protein
VASFAALLAAPLAAQTRRASGAGGAAPDSSGIRRAVATITEADYRRRIMLLADDSMRGRDTPSPELDEAAAWIAGEFRRFGLRPGGDDGSFQQRYTLRWEAMDTTASAAMVMGAGAHDHWELGRAAVQVTGGELREARGPVVLSWGTPAPGAPVFAAVDVRDAVVLRIIASAAWNGQVEQRVRAAAARGGARAVILVAPVGEATMQSMARFFAQPRMRVVGMDAAPPTVLVRDSAALGVAAAAGLDFAALRAAPAGTRRLDGFTGQLDLRRVVTREATAPNVIGVLEGSDPVLRGEYVAFTAHMDHVGVGRPVAGDSIYNGADDNASGTTGVIELAEAFAAMTPRPRRSLVFMLVSGEEKGLWGSEYYVAHPTVPLAQTVAAINMDMIGRNWRDTVSVIGKEHSTLGEVANRIARERPELNMQLVDDLWPNENFYRRSDHFNFARNGVPILFFFNGTHADYHRPSDHPDRIDAEKAARIVQMVFYLGLDVANTTARPQWNEESRRRIVEEGR